jgi:thymidylate synthase (FAD)
MIPEKLTRPSVPWMDASLGLALPVLDHGFVRTIDYMGNDAAIVQAARVSYGKGTEAVSTDNKLIRYLMRHWHSTPFEMCEIKLHVKLPVFCARQWIRHRTANVNEYSARYSILDREFYIPEPEQLMHQSQANKQGRAEILDVGMAQTVLDILKDDANRAYDHYEQMIEPEGTNLARELARMNLPANIYTQWYWKVDLHNLFHFLRLRADSHAQWEIRQYADRILNITENWVPSAHQAFLDYRLNAHTLSSLELGALKAILDTHDIVLDETSIGWLQTEGLSKREAQELIKKLGD